jgi:hypothetical protein
MRTLRPVIIVLGLVLVAGGTAYAATPEEQAVFREDARKLTEQVRGLEGQADTALEQTKQIYLAELRKVDGLEDQADLREVVAYQKWLQGAAPKKAQASLLHESARALLLEAHELGLRAEIVKIRAASARARESHFRTGAAAVLASGTDAETRSIAREMTQQANSETREANALENEAETLLRREENTKQRADALIKRAAELEASTP